MKGNAYTALAAFYARLTGSDYKDAQETLLSELKSRAVGQKGLDLGCGGGQTLLALSKAGYRMTGVDISQAMLEKASALLQGKKIPLFQQDMANLRLPERYDFAFSLTDGFNYIPPRSAAKALRAFHHALCPNGWLYLDLSSEYKLKTVLGNRLFGEDGEDITYLWFNRQTETGVQMDLTFFSRNPNGTYTKSEEAHTQYWYSAETLTRLLTENGFTVTDVCGENGTPYTALSHRLCVWARKQS